MSLTQHAVYEYEENSKQGKAKAIMLKMPSNFTNDMVELPLIRITFPVCTQSLSEIGILLFTVLVICQHKMSVESLILTRQYTM